VIREGGGEQEGKIIIRAVYFIRESRKQRLNEVDLNQNIVEVSPHFIVSHWFADMPQ
jgi:hypothetical protein